MLGDSVAGGDAGWASKAEAVVRWMTVANNTQRNMGFPEQVYDEASHREGPLEGKTINNRSVPELKIERKYFVVVDYLRFAALPQARLLVH